MRTAPLMSSASILQRARRCRRSLCIHMALAEGVRLYGLRNWIEAHCKRVKDELC